MYQGKRTSSKSNSRIKRKLAVMVSILLLLSAGFGATIAWLVDNTDDVQNVFTPAEVPPTIAEDFDGEVKQDVNVENTGNVSAYIRAAIVVTWQDADGNVAPETPVPGKDYSISLAEGNWSAKQDDGYYYYKNAVKAGKTTSALIEEAKQIAEYGDYKLVIEILAQTIQADGVDSNGKTPVELAWGEDAARLVGAIE